MVTSYGNHASRESKEICQAEKLQPWKQVSPLRQRMIRDMELAVAVPGRTTASRDELLT